MREPSHVSSQTMLPDYTVSFPAYIDAQEALRNDRIRFKKIAAVDVSLGWTSF